MKWYFETLRKYAVFAGRARRGEYWMFELWHGLILVALFVIDVKVSASGHNQAALLTGLYLLQLGSLQVKRAFAIAAGHMHLSRYGLKRG